MDLVGVGIGRVGGAGYVSAVSMYACLSCPLSIRPHFVNW